MIPLIERAVICFEHTEVQDATEVDRLVIQILESVGENSRIKKGQFHIARPESFTAAVRRLHVIYGKPEHITLWTAPKV